jgi:hypothetical protein
MTLLQGRALVHLAGIIPNAAGTLHAFWAIFGALEDIVFSWKWDGILLGSLGKVRFDWITM